MTYATYLWKWIISIDKKVDLVLDKADLAGIVMHKPGADAWNIVIMLSSYFVSTEYRAGRDRSTVGQN